MNQADQLNRKAVAHPVPNAIPQLDAVRVLAMLSIVLHHLWKTVIPVPVTQLQKILDPVFTIGSDGVIVFNIISGFLLAMPHLGPENRPFGGYRMFFQKRFLRIIPPYYLALVLFTAANMWRFDYPLVPALDLLAQHLFFVNSLNYSNMFTNFAQFWYLGLLAQFYLLFPLFLRFFMRVGPNRAALSIIALCWGGWFLIAWHFPEPLTGSPDALENLMHFNLPGRLPEFAIGMWLASMWNPSAASYHRIAFNRPFSLFAVAGAIYVVVGGFFRGAMNLPFIHIYDIPLCMFAFLGLLLWRPIERLGRSPVLKNISSHSYTVYIVHHPIFSYVGVMPSTVVHSVGNYFCLAGLLVPLSYFAAVAVDRASSAIVRIFSSKGKSP